MPEKTWYDSVKNGVESSGLSQKDAQFRNKWRRRIKGQLANPGSAEKWSLKRSVCVCVCACHLWCHEGRPVKTAPMHQKVALYMWTWHVRAFVTSSVKHLNTQVLKYYLNTMTGI